MKNITAATGASGDTLTLTSKIPGQQFIATVASTDVTVSSIQSVPNGSYTYTPATNYSGTDTFSYRVVDQFGLSSVAAILVNVLPESGPTIGGIGNDILFGGSGNDVLFGDIGADRLSGQLGSDVFIYKTNSDSNISTLDTIEDFSIGEDKIDFSGISGISYFGDAPESVYRHTGATVGDTVANIVADQTIKNAIVFTNDFVLGYHRILVRVARAKQQRFVFNYLQDSLLLSPMRSH